MLTERFENALTFAARAHAKQKRKGGDTPYLAHLMSVAALVLEHGGTEDEAIAALLHDAVEDQGGAPMHRRIVEAFGETVAGIVMGCSDTDQPHKPDWRHRKQRYIEHLADAPYGVLLVSLCDKVHNARSILHDVRRDGVASFNRFTAGREGTVWYYRTICDAFRANHHPATTGLVDELERIVSGLESLSGVDGRAVDLDAVL